MVRIQVQPDELRAVSAQLSHVAGELRGVAARLTALMNSLHWSGRARANVDQQMLSARSQAERMVLTAETMARYVSKKAHDFQEADTVCASEIEQFNRGVAKMLSGLVEAGIAIAKQVGRGIEALAPILFPTLPIRPMVRLLPWIGRSFPHLINPIAPILPLPFPVTPRCNPPMLL